MMRDPVPAKGGTVLTVLLAFCLALGARPSMAMAGDDDSRSRSGMGRLLDRSADEISGGGGPVAQDDATGVDEDDIVNYTVALNDSVPGDTAAVLSWSLLDAGSAEVNGSLVFSPDGSYTFIPDPDFNGTVVFTYTVCDTMGLCDDGEVTIVVNPVADPPIAGDDAYVMAHADTLGMDPGSNDSDADGDALSWTLLDGMSAAANGDLTVNADGTASYAPDTAFQGMVTFSYLVCDGGLLCDTGLVTIAVGDVNEPPTAVDDGVATTEETPVTVDVLANDSDADGELDAASVTITVPPGHGSAIVNADGTILYTPEADYAGPDALQYEVCDDGSPLPAECATAFLDINVDPVNDAPRPFDDTFAFLEDGGTQSGDVTGNDYDIDDENDTLVWSLVNSGTAAEHGALVFGTDGTFSYTSDGNFFGPVSFTYQVCDPVGLCTDATVVINVVPVNDLPVALGDVDNTLPDVPVTTNVSANDNDTTDQSAMDLGSITIVLQPDSGTADVNGNGTLTYTPNPGFVGDDTLIYQICDLGVPLPALCDTAILVIAVSTDHPLALDDDYDVPEDNTVFLDVLANDTALSGALDTATVEVINAPLHGTATVDPGGTITYTPDLDYYGPDAFNYSVCTDLGFCSNATVLINVDAVNDPPTALSDTVATDEDTPVTFNVVGNDSDPADGVFGGTDSSSVVIIIPPANGIGAVNVDGTITYVPGADLNGTDSLKYQVCDLGYPLPPECDTAWVVIMIGAVNDAPMITDAGGAPIDTLVVSTAEDVPMQLCFHAIDPDGGALDANSFLGPDFGTITGEADGDTCITFTPDPDYNGGDTVTVTICDGSGLCDTVVVVIAVLPVNDPPQGMDTVLATTEEELPVDICLAAIDVENDSVEVAGVAGGPGNGTVVGLADGDTCFSYSPDPDFNGTDTVQVLVCDNQGGCDTVTVLILVTPVNDPPVITDGAGSSTDTLSVLAFEDTPLIVCLDATDIDGDSLDVTSVPTGPFFGAVTGLQDADTCFTYSPDPGYVGADTLLSVVEDGNGGSDTIVVLITVLDVNDPPVIVEGGTPIDTLNVEAPEDMPLVICLEAIDADGDTLDVTGVFDGPGNGSVNGLADGDTCITYTPLPDWNGTDTLSAVVCDNHGGCDTVLIIIDVTPVNDPPLVLEGGVPVDTVSASSLQDTPVFICLEALDMDDDTLDVTEVTDDAGNGATSGIGDGDTCFTYTPDPGFFGTDTVTVTICDGAGACDTVTVVIDVTEVDPNEPPVAVDDTAGTDPGLAVDIQVLANDSDPDGDPLTVTSATAVNGSVTINVDGSITYMPDSGFCGTDTVTYTVCDPFLQCDSAVVLVEVECPPVNDPPIAVDDAATTPMNTPVMVTVLGNDSDPNGDVITVTAASAGNGSVVINTDGTITYTPAPGFCGVDTIAYIICDPGSLCDAAIVVVDVPCPPLNDPPIAVDDTHTVDPDLDILVPIFVLTNDTDPNGDPLTVTSAEAANGSVEIFAGSELMYTPDPGFCGMDTITYTVCDPQPLCDEALVFVTVLCPDTAELAIPEGFSPNNDGYGDTWTIAGLEKYPRARVTIFNRWGNEVYGADPYGNAWDGRSTNPLTWDGLLPVGTYWYLLDLGVEGEGVRSGYIYLNR